MSEFMTAKNTTVPNYGEGIKKVRGSGDDDDSDEDSSGEGSGDDDGTKHTLFIINFSTNIFS